MLNLSLHREYEEGEKVEKENWPEHRNIEQREKTHAECNACGLRCSVPKFKLWYLARVWRASGLDNVRSVATYNNGSPHMYTCTARERTKFFSVARGQGWPFSPGVDLGREEANEQIQELAQQRWQGPATVGVIK